MKLQLVHPYLSQPEFKPLQNLPSRSRFVLFHHNHSAVYWIISYVVCLANSTRTSQTLQTEDTTALNIVTLLNNLIYLLFSRVVRPAKSAHTSHTHQAKDTNALSIVTISNNLLVSHVVRLANSTHTSWTLQTIETTALNIVTISYNLIYLIVSHVFVSLVQRTLLECFKL